MATFAYDSTNSAPPAHEIWNGDINASLSLTSPAIGCHRARAVFITAANALDIEVEVLGTWKKFVPPGAGGGGLMKAPDGTDAGYISREVMPNQFRLVGTTDTDTDVKVLY